MKILQNVMKFLPPTIVRRLFLILTIFMLTLGAMLAYTISTMKRLERDAGMLGMAEYQGRMIPRYLNAVLLTSEGKAENYRGIQDSLTRNLQSLIHNGSVLHETFPGESLLLISSSLPRVWDQLDEQQELLSEIFQGGEQFIRLSHDDPARVSSLTFLSQRIHQVQEVADEVVTQLNAHSRLNSSRLLQGESGFAFLVILFSILLARQVLTASRRLNLEMEHRKTVESERNRFFSISSDLFCIATFEGFFKVLNPAWTHSLGFRLEDLQSRPFFDFIHPDDHIPTQKALQTLTSGQPLLQFENRYRGKDGTYKWFLWNATPDIDQHLIYATAHDVTSQKIHAQELALRDRSINSASNGILIADARQPDQPIVYCNAAFERITGYAKSEVMGKNCRFLQGTDRDQESLTTLRQALATGEECRVELRNYRKDGTFFWNELYIAPVRDDQGNLTHFIGVQTDITEAKQSRLASLVLASIVESCEEAIIGETIAGAIQSWNKGAERLYGYIKEEVIGKTVHILIPEEKFQEFKDIMRRVRSGEAIQQFETIRRGKDGKDIQVAITISPIIDHHGYFVGASTLAYDITDRKLREMELAQKTTELARSNQELQQFAYVASHDLQEPLRMISSYTQLLAKRYKGKLDQDADEFIAFAVEGANRMQRLIRDLLEYSRVGTKDMPDERIDGNMLMDTVMQNLSSSIRECEARIHIDPLPILTGNVTQLTQLFQNLIGNALKFRKGNAPHISITVQKEPSSWKFGIRDNGIGIPFDQQDRIFALFQRLHHSTTYAGTGIGLAICKKIVQCHGGQIWVESVPGEGSTFYFTLPSDTESSEKL